MISNHLSMIERNCSETARLAAAMAEFESRGGQVARMGGFSGHPIPPARSDKVDPDTILKRRRPSPTQAERKIFRRLAEAP